MIAKSTRSVADTTRMPRARPRRSRAEGEVSTRRLWQVVVAAVGFALLLPVSAVVALAIRLTSPGPILYRGQRVGRRGQPFTIYKFRTLMVGAEEKIGGRLLNPGDHLYTPIGRFLKRTKLDEIPQLINVIKGDMNLVGPRPVRPVFLDRLTREIPRYRTRFEVLPGMTGLAQLRGGYFTTPRDKLRYDLLYIRRRSWWLDVKLVSLTFVKLLNRWLTLGALLLLLFLSATFLPTIFQEPLELNVAGFRLSPFELGVFVLSLIFVVRQLPENRLYFYRCPLNPPMAGFVLVCLLGSVFSADPADRLRDLAYYIASGFGIVLLVVNGQMHRSFAVQATRVVALAAVLVSAIGIVEVALDQQTGAQGVGRISATLGSPVVLAAYLVLGIPLVLCELTRARPGPWRDFWLISTTLAIVGVVLSQTRMGLLALAITGAVFLSRVSYRALAGFATAAVAFVLATSAVGGLRLSRAEIASEWSRRVAVTGAVLVRLPEGNLLFGETAEMNAVGWAESAQPPARTRKREGSNMHLTLIAENGLLGWALMMWLLITALRTLYRGATEMADPRLRLILWSVFSSVIGFLVSMSNFNAFYHPTIQIFFWGLVGVGVGITTHLNGRRPSFNVIWRFGHDGHPHGARQGDAP
jgi:lipopolysaccharide/colanic/teichoic acid biosynthesis glycosyltransferase